LAQRSGLSAGANSMDCQCSIDLTFHTNPAAPSDDERGRTVSTLQDLRT
jgi:hypothetical protein